MLGLACVIFFSKQVQKYSFGIVSFAAGVLLATSFLHLAPESYEIIGEKAFFWTVVGFAIFYVLESIIGYHVCRENEDCDYHTMGPVAGMGIFFHSLIDGIAIAIGFEVSSTLGLVTTMAVMLHEFPEGIFTLSILLHSGLKKKKAIVGTLLVALATPFGALLTILFAPNLSVETLGILLALASGSFLYIGASDLVPESHKARSLSSAIFVMLGIILMLWL